MAAVEDLATFMSMYSLKGQHTPDRSLTRYRHDLCKMAENNEISTGPGRYMLAVPNRYGNAAFVSEPTVLNQHWGAAHDMTTTKTDVESDLTNRGRPSVRTVCGQYVPGSDAAGHTLTAMPEVAWPRNYERLTDPASTLRGTGWNRWEWLCHNPQEGVMMPFEHSIESRSAAKDVYLTRLGVAKGTPLSASAVAADHRFKCDELYVEPAVPVARPQAPGAPPNYTDAIPGSSQRSVGAPAVSRVPVPAWGASQRSESHKDHHDVGAHMERIRAETGVMTAPPPFTAYLGDSASR